MMRFWRALLIVIAVVCFGVALSYPIRYRMAQESNNSNMEALSAMRSQSRTSSEQKPAAEPRASAEAADPDGASSKDAQSDAPGASPVAVETVEANETVQTADARPASAARPEGETDPLAQLPTEARPEGEADPSIEGDGEAPEAVRTAEPTAAPSPSPTPGLLDLILSAPLTPTPAPTWAIAARNAPDGPTLAPSPTPDRSIREGALAYPYKEKIVLDEEKILPELREIYALNHDLAGWIVIPDTVVDYPVVQCQDSEFYLKHDFYGEENSNGQIILDTRCDPYTPSYNLVISGHHMKSGSMFGGLTDYRNKSYWEQHKFLEFDTLMSRKQYVIFAAFYSADYDEDEEGFRYNADIQYRKEAEQWLAEIHENELYDTGIDAEFGDEFITLTTCTRTRRSDGRFVLVCREIREGETFE